MRIPLPTWLRVPIAALIFSASTIVHVLVLLCFALLKALVPLARVRRFCDAMLMAIVEAWTDVNTLVIRALTRTRIVVDNDVMLRANSRYLVLSNHQSWVDIPMLHVVLNRRIPLLRFFLKSQLIWVPFLGLAWWALDFPFMKRYSRETLAKHPELAGRDIAATRKACAKFSRIPVAVMNFVEGTRFTIAKHRAQASPFNYLLKPKAGGTAFVLDAMGGLLESILDITIVYPHGIPTFADLFADRIPEVRVRLRERAIPRDLVGGDYQNDPQVRERAQAWINEVWLQKDASIAQMRRL